MGDADVERQGQERTRCWGVMAGCTGAGGAVGLPSAALSFNPRTLRMVMGALLNSCSPANFRARVERIAATLPAKVATPNTASSTPD